MVDSTQSIRSYLSNERYDHTLRVLKIAEQLANVYQFKNIQELNQASMFHDIAKRETPDSIRRFNISISTKELSDYKKFSTVWHALIAPKLVKKLFNIKSQQVIKAIKHHTTGNANMGLLEKIIFIADFIEPNRTFKEAKEARKMAFENLDKTILFITKSTLRLLLNKNIPVHPFTINCYNYYLN